ncbi:hypothetical protein A3L09_05560 [Thermococcus profundus]|uniref:Uncharacterized protein n=1 Tax=Thermococcus profundus TaxID=49899 RepID=A0A2Z2MDR0_THEPR|nr:hypothetical protein [Thermococcus profundus]ASJ02755.1 hypothetical protein A3L09_05560 [Thermococcus profundus]
MRKLISFLFILFLAVWSLKAYQVHQTLTNPEKMLQLSKENGNEALIGSYVKKGTLGPKWELVLYNPQTQEVAIVSLSEKISIIPRLTKKLKVYTTQYDYSLLTIDPKLIKRWNGDTPALLFNGKWHYKPNTNQTAVFQSISGTNATIIGLFYSKDDFWMGFDKIRVCNSDFGYPSAGPGSILVPPDVTGTGSPTVSAVITRKNNNSETLLTFFDGTVLNLSTRTAPECSLFLFGGRLGMAICSKEGKKNLEGSMQRFSNCTSEVEDSEGIRKAWEQNMEWDRSGRMALFIGRPVDGASRKCSNEAIWIAVTLKCNGCCGDERSGKLG